MFLWIIWVHPVSVANRLILILIEELGALHEFLEDEIIGQELCLCLSFQEEHVTSIPRWVEPFVFIILHYISVVTKSLTDLVLESCVYLFECLLKHTCQNIVQAIVASEGLKVLKFSEILRIGFD